MNIFPLKFPIAVPHRLVRAGTACVGTLALICSSIACGQTAPPQRQNSPQGQNSKTDSPAAAPAPNSEADVMAHLDLTMRWYRQWSSVDVYLSRAGDQIYIESGQSIAEQVLKLEFQSALAQAVLIGASSARTGAMNSSAQKPVEAQNIFKARQRLDLQMQTLKTQLDAVNGKIPSARVKDRSGLLTRRDTLQGQLQLAQALQDNLDKLTTFMTSAENATGSTSEMTARILALQKTVPSLAVGTQAPSKSAGKSSAPAAQPSRFSLIGNSQNQGLIGQMGEMIHLLGSLRVLNQLRDDTAALQASTRQLRTPLIAALRSTLKQGQIDLANAGAGNGENAQGSQAATNANGGAGAVQQNGSAQGPPASISAEATETPAQEQREMSELVRHFKQLSSATLPLSQELILVEQSEANLDQLRTSINRDYGAILRSLLLRVAMILIALGAIWLFSWLWRRATFRYIHDARRRRQFLVLRRAITGFCMFVVVMLGFVSDFSSLATYAGLITAGVAVALQAVILSIAAYFFLVGRYGVRVGDRVTVVYNAANAVSGDVVDIGLVRFYMMELAGNGVDMRPTGRICVFPNSVLFQTNPLFKQMPGAEYTWREIALPLHSEANVDLAEKALLAAVSDLYASYREMLERRRMTAEETMALHPDVPQPSVRVRFTGSGLEAVARYPIPLRQAAELDDRMVKDVVELLRKNPEIRLADGASPVLRS